MSGGTTPRFDSLFGSGTCATPAASGPGVLLSSDTRIAIDFFLSIKLIGGLLEGTMATWKRNNDVGIGGIEEGGLSVPSTFVRTTAEEQQVRCPTHHDWSEKIEKVHSRSFSLLREPLRN
jgi:hypothetical protein